MLSPESQRRVTLVGIGLLLLPGPVAILVLTVGFLLPTGDLIRGRVTPLEFPELSIIDALLFDGLAYGIYRLTLKPVEGELPVTVEPDGVLGLDGHPNDGSEPDTDERDCDRHGTVPCRRPVAPGQAVP